MKVLCYAVRKIGSHGFLKMLDGDPETLTDERFAGPEIHFRVNKTLADAVQKAFGNDKGTDGKPLGLVVRNRKREADLLDWIPLKTPQGRDMDDLWAELLHHAKDVGEQGSIMDRYETNCNTLVFEVLRRANIEAPHEYYDALLTRVKAEDAAAMDWEP